jgi:hypothetical protein
MIEVIHAFIVMGSVPVPGEREYKLVIRELANGNTKALEAFLKRGGKIPVEKEASHDA